MQLPQGPLKAVIGYFQVVACFEFDKWWVLVAVRVDACDEARHLFCAGRAVRHGASENRHVAHGVANFAEVKVFEVVIVELEFESVGVEPVFCVRGFSGCRLGVLCRGLRNGFRCLCGCRRVFGYGGRRPCQHMRWFKLRGAFGENVGNRGRVGVRRLFCAAVGVRRLARLDEPGFLRVYSPCERGALQEAAFLDMRKAAI